MSILLRNPPDLPAELRPYVTCVHGNVSRMRDAKLVIVKDPDHDHELTQLTLKLFVNMCIKKGDILMREGRPCLVPVPASESWLTTKQRERAQEVGWDEMTLHAFCSETFTMYKQYLPLKGTKEGDILEKALLARLPLHTKCLIHGRNLAMLKAVQSFPDKTKYLVGGASHFPAYFLVKLLKIPFLIFTIKQPAS